MNQPYANHPHEEQEAFLPDVLHHQLRLIAGRDWGLWEKDLEFFSQREHREDENAGAPPSHLERRRLVA
jgi:hypothetical protein